MTKDELEAMTKAREAGQQTPPAVRTGFLAGPREVAGLTLQPLSLGALWLLEAVEHPLLGQRPDAATTQLGIPEICAALFIFTKPSEARAAIVQSREEFDLAAGGLADSIPFTALPELVAALTAIVTEGLATAPVGDGKRNPRA